MLSKPASLRRGTPQYIRSNLQLVTLFCCRERRLLSPAASQFSTVPWLDSGADITSSWCTTDTGQHYGDHISLLQHICSLSLFTERDEIEVRFWTSCAYFFEIKSVNNLSGTVCSRITPPVTISTSYESYQQLNTVRAHYYPLIHLYASRYSSYQLPTQSSLMLT